MPSSFSKTINAGQRHCNSVDKENKGSEIRLSEFEFHFCFLLYNLGKSLILFVLLTFSSVKL